MPQIDLKPSKRVRGKPVRYGDPYLGHRVGTKMYWLQIIVFGIIMGLGTTVIHLLPWFHH